MKKIKKYGLAGLIATSAIILSGCVRTDSHGHPFGFVYNYLAIPGQHVMDWLAKYVGGYGWSLIVITVLVRCLLLPLMINQLKKSTIQQEKMGLVKPQMTKLQNLMKNAKSQEEQMALNQQMMKLYRDNNISMTGGIGCLPMLIQIPVFAALYAAIRYSPELSHTMFMGIQLGQKSFLLAALSFIVYAVQGYLSILGMPKAQRKQMGMMMIISPVMIFFVSMSSPAGLGIYFFIGGLFAILQQLIVNAYRPKIIKQINEEAKKNPPKVVIPDSLENTETAIEKEENNKKINDVETSDSKDDEKEETQAEKNRRRNLNHQQNHNE